MAKAKRQLYTTVVLKRDAGNPKLFELICEDGLTGIGDADAKVKELAGENPGEVFCAAKMRKAIVAQEVRQVTFLNADDNSKVDEDDVDDNEDDDDEDEASEGSATTPQAAETVTTPDPEPEATEPAAEETTPDPEPEPEATEPEATEPAAEVKSSAKKSGKPDDYQDIFG